MQNMNTQSALRTVDMSNHTPPCQAAASISASRLPSPRDRHYHRTPFQSQRRFAVAKTGSEQEEEALDSSACEGSSSSSDMSDTANSGEEEEGDEEDEEEIEEQELSTCAAAVAAPAAAAAAAGVSAVAAESVSPSSAAAAATGPRTLGPHPGEVALAEVLGFGRTPVNFIDLLQYVRSNYPYLASSISLLHAFLIALEIQDHGVKRDALRSRFPLQSPEYHAWCCASQVKTFTTLYACAQCPDHKPVQMEHTLMHIIRKHGSDEQRQAAKEARAEVKGSIAQRKEEAERRKRKDRRAKKKASRSKSRTQNDRTNKKESHSSKGRHIRPEALSTHTLSTSSAHAVAAAASPSSPSEAGSSCTARRSGRGCLPFAQGTATGKRVVGDEDSGGDMMAVGAEEWENTRAIAPPGELAVRSNRTSPPPPIAPAAAAAASSFPTTSAAASPTIALRSTASPFAAQGVASFAMTDTDGRRQGGELSSSSPVGAAANAPTAMGSGAVTSSYPIPILLPIDYSGLSPRSDAHSSPSPADLPAANAVPLLARPGPAAGSARVQFAPQRDSGDSIIAVTSPSTLLPPATFMQQIWSQLNDRELHLTNLVATRDAEIASLRLERTDALARCAFLERQLVHHQTAQPRAAPNLGPRLAHSSPSIHASDIPMPPMISDADAQTRDRRTSMHMFQLQQPRSVRVFAHPHMEEQEQMRPHAEENSSSQTFGQEALGSFRTSSSQSVKQEQKDEQPAKKLRTTRN